MPQLKIQDVKDELDKFKADVKNGAVDQSLEERLDKLEASLNEYRSNAENFNNSKEQQTENSKRKYSSLRLLQNELIKIATLYNVPEFRYINYLTPTGFNPVVADSVNAYLSELDEKFSQISNSANDRKDRFYTLNSSRLNQIRNDYYNYKLEEIVTKYYERKKILIYNNSIIQNIDPVYLDSYRKGLLDFRTHFYAPAKYIFGIRTDTFIFNISLVLLSTLLLYLTLYFDLLAKAVRFIEEFKIRKRLFSNLVICFFIFLY